MEKRVYFKNLSALRFIASVAVIFHHVEQYKYWSNLPNLWGKTTIDALGHKAVSFFFVLSGFLITYLLLTENKQTGEINVRNFYIRRILRIWPLYYLIVILCLFVMPLFFTSIDYSKNYLVTSVLMLLILPNLVRLYNPMVVGGNQLWSIGVEEQFYIIWPLLIRKFIRKMPIFLVAFIAIKLLITIALEYSVAIKGGLFLNRIFKFWTLLQFEQMAIGALGAWFLFAHRENVLKIIYQHVTYYLSLLAVAALFVLPIHHWWINYAEAVAFIIMIMNLSTNPAIKLSLENKLMTTLGNISYGIYMYHTLCITVCLSLLKHYQIETFNFTLFNILLYTLSIISSILVAYLSYEFMEKKFLMLKERFMIIKSGNQAELAAEPVKKTVVSARQ